VRARVLDERVDHGAGAGDLADRVRGEHDRRAVPCDRDDVLDGRRADADRDGLLCVHAGIQRARPDGVTARGPIPV